MWPTGWYPNKPTTHKVCFNKCSISYFHRITVKLTDDGENDNDKVKDVPADGEEVASERHDLDEALGGEDNDEGQVDVVQDVLHLRRLLVRLHHHGDHVEEDQHHDDYIKRLFPNQVEEEPLYWVLERKNSGSFIWVKLFLLFCN